MSLVYLSPARHALLGAAIAIAASATSLGLIQLAQSTTFFSLAGSLLRWRITRH
jgi:cytochrome c-type biogenesis protein CcmE